MAESSNAYQSQFSGKLIDHLIDLINKSTNNPGSVLSTLKGFRYISKANPTDNPGTPTTQVFYLADKAGVYPHFGGISVNKGVIAILSWNGAVWTKEEIVLPNKDNYDDLNDRVTKLEEQIVLISEEEFKELESKGKVDPEKIYMIYEDE